ARDQALAHARQLGARLQCGSRRSRHRQRRMLRGRGHDAIQPPGGCRIGAPTSGSGTSQGITPWRRPRLRRQDRSMTFPTAPPPAPERPQPPRRTDRFFAWVAGLGVARSDGWIGGVAAGIASRLRIDPLIVRGVLVVTALFGLPMIFLYALAWALLPDPDGRIHLRELVRGRFEPAQLGILAGLLVGMLAVTPSASLFLVERIVNPYSYQSYGMSDFGVFLFILGLVLVGILL